MTGYLIPLLLLLLVLGVLLQDRFVFTLFYLLGGSYVLGSWWSRRALRAVRTFRSYPHRIFHGETAEVRLDLENSGWLPVIWMRLHESRPAELAVSDPIRRVLSLGPYEAVSYAYSVVGRKRGYYSLGPAALSSGDLFGLSAPRAEQSGIDYLTVFPKIIPLHDAPLLSQIPLGSLREALPFFEDPSRPVGKRDYQSGDSLRLVDWKTSAAVGRLQVKVNEPSISLETAIFLNMAASDYDRRSRFDSTELAVVAAASLASWIIARKQAAGLVTNGIDPLMSGPNTIVLSPAPGRGRLLQILETLARVRSGQACSFETLIREESYRLSWGTTPLIITGQLDDPTFEALIQGRRRGLGIVLFLVGPNVRYREISARAHLFGMPVFHIYNERDLSRLGALHAGI